MAEVRSIFQPIYSTDRHENEIKMLLSGSSIRVIFSVAFVRFEGINQIAIALTGKLTEVYIGIRNGVTTAQGVLSLLRTGAKVYAVDTGYGAAIFHPKFYCTIQNNRAKVIIGSANLTFSGLNNNLEASALIELDRKNPKDEDFLLHLINGVMNLPTDFPENCYQIKDRRKVVEMLNDGLLEDEKISRDSPIVTPRYTLPPTAKIVPKIRLDFKSLPQRSGSKKIAKPSVISTSPIPGVSAPRFGMLLWEKTKLPTGDLQLLTNGHGSGVLRLTQAGFQVNGKKIDQTKYFRYVAFGGLSWVQNTGGKETAIASFALVINSVYFGKFDLKLSHKASWESGQGNYTTGLHWGKAVNIIKNKSLVGRTLRLYAPSALGAPYLIEID